MPTVPSRLPAFTRQPPGGRSGREARVDIEAQTGGGELEVFVGSCYCKRNIFSSNRVGFYWKFQLNKAQAADAVKSVLRRRRAWLWSGLSRC